jgi:hypothetical protein
LRKLRPRISLDEPTVYFLLQGFQVNLLQRFHFMHILPLHSVHQFPFRRYATPIFLDGFCLDSTAVFLPHGFPFTYFPLCRFQFLLGVNYLQAVTFTNSHGAFSLQLCSTNFLDAFPQSNLLDGLLLFPQCLDSLYSLKVGIPQCH